ncbi:hypothetical protein [Microcoleus sp. D2_18a_B4]|uniref:hypothetical protein n=1 Tax=Microcoleus sp. D2_18a_B4 TaxID=3055329 RepID=UPI002FCF68B3
MSKQSSPHTKKSSHGTLIMGLGLLALGMVSFLYRGEELTIKDLLSCIITAGVSFFLLPIFLMVFILMAASPITGVIFLFLGVMLFLSQPAYATGLGITITSLGLITMSKKNQNDSNLE